MVSRAHARRRTAAALSVVALLGGGCSVAPPGPESVGAIEGMLSLEDGDPAAGALVSGGGRSTSAGAQGAFRLAPLDDGSYELEIEADGHGTTRLASVAVAAQRATDAGLITLLRQAELDSVVAAGNTDLDAARSYLVNGRVAIAAGETLRLGEATRLVLSSGAALEVRGALETSATGARAEIVASGSGESGVLLSAGSGPHILRNTDFSTLYEALTIAEQVVISIEDCRFQDMGRVGIVSSGSSVEVSDCEFLRSTYGIELFNAGSSSITWSLFEDCERSALVVSSTTVAIEDNRFLSCNTAIELSVNSTPEIVHNLFQDNVTGISGSGCSIGANGMRIDHNSFESISDIDLRLSLNCYPVVTGNNFSTTSNFACSSPKNTIADTLDAGGNYWGTGDAARIPGRIYDARVNATRAPVRYQPFELSPLPGTGPE